MRFALRKNVLHQAEQLGRAEARLASALSAKQRKNISPARIEAALEVVAILMDDNPAYLPIFQRLEAELQTARISSSALARARALAQKARAR